MFSFSLIVILAGFIILLGIGIWTNQRRHLGAQPGVEQELQQRTTRTDHAVIVARQHGQILYTNDNVSRWLGLEEGTPSLEYLAANAHPADNLRGLFVEDARAAFQFGGRWVEGSSNLIPAGDELHIVVTLRELRQQPTLNPNADFDISAALLIIEEIGETVNASLGVDQSLQTILTIISKNIPIDGGEIALWDAEAEALYQRGWVGNAAYVLSLATAGGMYQLGEGITGWVAQQREPLLVSDVNTSDAVLPKLADNPYHSFVAVPLQLGEHFLGTLELTHETADYFGTQHMALLQAISKAVSTAVYNAELYAAQVKRIDDIASLQQITRGRNLSTDVEEVYAALTRRIADLIDVTVAGVLLYSDRRKALVAQPPFHGLPDQLTPLLAVDVREDAPGYHIWEHQEYWISNDPDEDPMVAALGLDAVVAAAGLRNMILVTMHIGQQRLGMMYLANKNTLMGFTTRDVQNLRILVTQAAIVVESVRLFQREKRQDAELVGLQEITHAIGVLSSEDPEYVYSDINRRIAGLMSIELCGVLLYDELQDSLVAQLPFFGVEDEAVGGYAIDLTRNEVIRELWEEEDYWYSNRVRTEAIVFSAGLAELAERIGVEKTLFASLTAGGQKIGLIQVSNKRSGDDFTENDARLLLIFATQAAAILENARLVQEVQRRATEADRLRQIAERAGNLVTLDESLAPVLSPIAELTHSQLVFLRVINEESGALVMTPRSVFGVELDVSIRYDRETPAFARFVAVTQQPLILNNPTADTPYHELADRLGLACMAVVPLVIGERSLGELCIANRPDGYYDEDDLTLLETIAAQLASTVDRVRLFDAAGQSLSRRVRELDAISQVSNVLNVTFELDTILQAIYEEAAAATGAGGGTVVVVRPVDAFVRATGAEAAAPRLVSRVGGAAAMAEDLADVERNALDQPEGVVVVEVYAQTAMTPLPPAAVSAVALVFEYASVPVGVIHLYDERPAWFNEQSVSFLRTLASKAALGYGNAVRYEDQLSRSGVLRQRVEQLNQIFELGQMIQTNVDQSMMLEAIAHSIVTSVGFDVVVMTMVESADNVLRRVTQAGLPVDVFERSKSDVLSVEQVNSLLDDNHRISESYFYAIEDIIEMEIAGLDALSAAFIGNRTMDGTGENAWQDGDMLLVPIQGANSDLLGIISLDRPQDNQRPGRSKIEILEIFAHQAATTIENNRLYLDSVRNAEQEARLNAMLEDMAGTLDVDEIIESVAQNAMRLAPFDHMVAALSYEGGFEVTRVVIQTDSTLVTSKEWRADLNDTALGRSITENRERIYTRRSDMAAYEDLKAWYKDGEQVSFVFPLASGGEVLGALHFGGQNLAVLDVEDFSRLFSRVAQLMAVSIQNARLFDEAVDLRLFNESVLESIQQGIVVLDRSGRVISANQFMQDEYNWEMRGPRQDIFTYSPELADVLADDLRAVLETAEPRQILNEYTHLTVTGSDNFVVRNFYIYPLIAQDTVNGAVLLVEDVTERARLEANVADRASQLAALTRASGRITSTLNPEAVIETALDEMNQIIPFDTITLWQRERTGSMRLMGVRGVNVSLSPPIRAEADEATRIGHIVNKKTALLIDDLPHFMASYPYVLPGDQEMGSWMGVPLVYQGDVVGMISLAKAEVGYYEAQAEQAVMAFANQVAVALSNAELFEDTQARTKRLSVLNRVSLALVQSMDSENIVEIALTEISNTINAEKARAIMFDSTNTVARVLVDSPRGEVAPTRLIEVGQDPILLHIVNRMQPLVYSHDRAYMPEDVPEHVRDEIEMRGLKDYLVIPMIAPGQMIGVFEFETRSQDLVLGAETLETGLIIANQSAIAIQNANQLDETTLRTRELETLLDAAQATSLTMELDEVFRTVTEQFIRALDVDDCAVMIWDDVENTLEVQFDMNRSGDPSRISPKGTRFDIDQYPSRGRALRKREVVVVNVDDEDTDTNERKELIAQGDQARMFVPLVVRDQSIGLIQVEITNPFRKINAQERRLARALGAQVAISIENARLSTEASAQMEELFMMNDLSQSISANINVDDMLAIVRERVPSVTDAKQLYVALYDDDTNEITFPLAIRDGEEYDIPPRKLGSDEVSFVIRNRRPLLLGSDYFAADDVRKSLGLTNGEGDILSYLGVPLIAGDDVLGVLAVRDQYQPRVFGLNDQRILTTVGSQLGATLQNARLFRRVQNFAERMNEEVQERTEELQEERDRLDMLYQITAELALTLDMDRVLNRALQMMASAVKADDGVIMLIDPMTDRLYNRASLTRGEAEERPTHPAEMLATWLIHNDHELLVDDLKTAEYWDASVPGAEPWRSAMAVLLETNEDVQGVLVLLSEQVAAFSDPLLNLVIAAANQVASAINNADLYQLIRDQAERLGTLLRTEQEEADKSRAILEGIADGVMLTDNQGQISLFNSAAEEMLGLSKDKVMGHTLDDLIAQYGDEVEAWARPIMEWTSYTDNPQIGLTPTDRLEVGDRTVSVNIASVQSGAQHLGSVSVFRDVTRDVEVDNLKNEFVLNVTHEFRTPMTSIKGYLELLMMDQMTDQQRMILPVVKSNTDRLAALVEDLLTVSKIDVGETLSVEPVDLANVVDIQLTNAQNRHYDKNHTVTLKIDETLPRATLDRRKTLQIIGNLIDNAFNYTPAGGKIEIALYMDPDEDKAIRFHVKDNGLGIPESFKDKIWDRFSRNEDHALLTASAGTGLGLAIVRELVRMHAGRVWFESQEGAGTTFYVTFPIEHKRSASTNNTLNAVSGD